MPNQGGFGCFGVMCCRPTRAYVGRVSELPRNFRNQDRHHGMGKERPMEELSSGRPIKPRNQSWVPQLLCGESARIEGLSWANGCRHGDMSCH